MSLCVCICEMDLETVSAMLGQNLSTVKTFVQILFDKLNREVRDLKEENVELKRSLEFSQAEIADLKVIVPDLRATKETEDLISELRNRMRVLEDFNRRKIIRVLA